MARSFQVLYILVAQFVLVETDQSKFNVIFGFQRFTWDSPVKGPTRVDNLHEIINKFSNKKCLTPISNYLGVDISGSSLTPILLKRFEIMSLAI